MGVVDRVAANMREPATGEEPDRGHLLQLSSRSRDLLQILLDGKGAAGALYEGALRTLADPANPVSVQMAAYALREVIEELEKAAGVASKGQQMGERVTSLSAEWTRISRTSDGGLGDGATKTLAVLDEFFAWHAAEFPTRRNRAQTTIRGLDPAQRDAPPDVRDTRANSLMEFRRAFNLILHGHHAPDVTEFRESTVGSFETFLLDWFRPRTFTDFDALDRILVEGPPDG